MKITLHVTKFICGYPLDTNSDLVPLDNIKFRSLHLSNAADYLPIHSQAKLLPYVNHHKELASVYGVLVNWSYA